MNLNHIAVVESFRGSTLECTFRGSAAIVEKDGRIVSYVGDPYAISTIRSTAKPFQVIPLLEHPAYRSLGLTSEELAVMVASHNGESTHIETIQGLMRKTGVDVHELRCGTHPPLMGIDTSDIELLRMRLANPVYHNCSGNHLSMILLSRLLGVDPGDYRTDDHEVQKQIAWAMSEVIGVEHKSLVTSLDGCGIPTFAMRIDQLAFAFASLASTDRHGVHGSALIQVKEAMMQNPFLIAGTGRLETDLMRTIPVVAKIGSQGVYGIGIPESDVGIAIKIESGSSEAAESFAVDLLHRLGYLGEEEADALSNFRYRPILAPEGVKAGSYRPTTYVISNSVPPHFPSSSE